MKDKDKKQKKRIYDREWNRKNYARRKEVRDTYYLKNRDTVLATHKRLRDYWKNQMVRHFGGCCRVCGFADIRALQVDHIKGGGYQDKDRKAGYRYYVNVINDLNGKYQLLCANCNMIKKFSNDEHPKVKRQ